ncbi:2-C-methyl-D-erythritol 2,4-cyclodiphosphate synthase [Roseimarinus sediminis]|uniref:2-C-methyl-D-erythritol 2,4-cyclodiphosphate synthase n=1 Tax=Roseimarinus sediminis TaxID=1610899 RepID=UPI003D1D6F8D
MQIRIGHGYDVHALAEGESLWLGGISIPHHQGTIAHSDGDVLIHAICDALLGALALGDVGQHFPDTHSDFKNIDSKILLAKCHELIKAAGYHIVNIDSTLAAQQPKLKDYIVPMREKLAETLHVEAERISVKATTTEKLGFVGREEGIEAHAVVLLEKQ